jgi:hypothetical protein
VSGAGRPLATECDLQHQLSSGVAGLSAFECLSSLRQRPFLGTVWLEALPYGNVDISKFYPYGDPRPFQQRSRPC